MPIGEKPVASSQVSGKQVGVRIRLLEIAQPSPAARVVDRVIWRIVELPTASIALADHEDLRGIPDSVQDHRSKDRFVGPVGNVDRIFRGCQYRIVRIRRAAVDTCAAGIGLAELAPGCGSIAEQWQGFIVVLCILHDTQANLFEIRLAGRSPRIFANFRKHGKEHGGQKRDDRDDHEQFDQGKPGLLLSVVHKLFIPECH